MTFKRRCTLLALIAGTAILTRCSRREVAMSAAVRDEFDRYRTGSVAYGCQVTTALGQSSRLCHWSGLADSLYTIELPIDSPAFFVLEWRGEHATMARFDSMNTAMAQRLGEPWKTCGGPQTYSQFVVWQRGLLSYVLARTGDHGSVSYQVSDSPLVADPCQE